MKIEKEPRPMRGLRLVGEDESGSASTIYGPVRAGLTTWQTTQDQQLTELLRSLENIVASLNYKSFEVYDTLNTAIEAVSVALSSTPIDEAGTDV